jgi:molecular chaperone GrpE (heat shock protein)
MQPFTLNQAAKACNKSKSTLLAAINSGRLSAKRDDKNQWQIDPAELFRVYDSRTPELVTEHQTDHHNRTPENHQNTDLIDALRAQIEQLTSQVKREQENADNWKNQATMLLTHQSEPETRKEDNTKLLFKLFGKHRPNG